MSPESLAFCNVANATESAELFPATLLEYKRPSLPGFSRRQMIQIDLRYAAFERQRRSHNPLIRTATTAAKIQPDAGLVVSFMLLPP
jgi:hypothetical protein